MSRRGCQKLSGPAVHKPITVTIHCTDVDMAGINDNTLVPNYWDGSKCIDNHPWSRYGSTDHKACAAKCGARYVSETDFSDTP